MAFHCFSLNLPTDFPEESATEECRLVDGTALQNSQRHDATVGRLRRYLSPRGQGRRPAHFLQARRYAAGEGWTGGRDAPSSWVGTRSRHSEECLPDLASNEAERYAYEKSPGRVAGIGERLIEV